MFARSINPAKLSKTKPNVITQSRNFNTLNPFNSTFTPVSTLTHPQRFVIYGTATIGTASCGLSIYDVIQQSADLSHTGALLLMNGTVISAAAIYCTVVDINKNIESAKSTPLTSSATNTKE